MKNIAKNGWSLTCALLHNLLDIFFPMMHIFEKYFMAEGSIFVTSTTQRTTKQTADAAFTVLSQLACCRYRIQ